MTDLYTELITNVNATIDTLEEDGATAAKATHAVYAENADSVENADSADHADEVDETSNATFATASANMPPISMVGSGYISSGIGIILSDGMFEDNGVYLVVYKNLYSSYYVHTYTGIIVFKTGKNATTRLSNLENWYGGSLLLKPVDTGKHRVDIIDTAGRVTSTAAGTIYFYKIGTIE